MGSVVATPRGHTVTLHITQEDIALNDEKYKSFDRTAVRDLSNASKTLVPSMTEFQGAVMIADVKGFTQLTEILSKKGMRELSLPEF